MSVRVCVPLSVRLYVRKLVSHAYTVQFNIIIIIIIMKFLVRLSQTTIGALLWQCFCTKYSLSKYAFYDDIVVERKFRGPEFKGSLQC